MFDLGIMRDKSGQSVLWDTMDAPSNGAGLIVFQGFRTV